DRGRIGTRVAAKDGPQLGGAHRCQVGRGRCRAPARLQGTRQQVLQAHRILHVRGGSPAGTVVHTRRGGAPGRDRRRRRRALVACGARRHRGAVVLTDGSAGCNLSTCGGRAALLPPCTLRCGLAKETGMALKRIYDNWQQLRAASGTPSSRQRREWNAYLEKRALIGYWGDSWFSTPLYRNLCWNSFARIDGMSIRLGGPGLTAAQMLTPAACR